MDRITLASSAGFCFGVKRAVDIALTMKEKYNSKVYTLGPLIHNNDVVDFLKENLIFPIELDSVSCLKENDTIIIRSHGVSEETLNFLKKNNFNIVDATCPYVENIHKKVEKYYKLGYGIIIVGDKNHPEVIGINGWCDDSALIFKSGEEVVNVPRKVCVVSQTTERESTWEEVLAKIISSSKEIVAFNTICSATQVRQESAEELSKKVDAMVVIGGFNSSNTTKLYEICKKSCENTIHVENLLGIPDDFIKSERIRSIGVTAGASTPDWIIKEAISKMNDNTYLTKEENPTKLLKEAFESKNPISVIVKEVVNSGLICSLKGLRVFVPASHIELDYVENLDSYLGKELEVTIIEFDDSNRNVKIVGSRRLILQKKLEEKQLEVWDDLEKGQIVEAIVKRLTDFGAFVSVDGIDGLIHVSEISWANVNKPSNYLHIGDVIKVYILEVDKQNKKLSLSMKKLIKNPWIDLLDKYPLGSIVRCKVVRFTNFGAFVELEPGVDGLIHISEISHKHIEKISDILKIGQEVKAKIVEVNEEMKKISLSIKQVIEV